MVGFNINDLLNAKSKGAAVQAEGPAEQEQEFKVTMLDVEDLMPSKDNFYSTENIDELAMSIELWSEFGDFVRRWKEIMDE